MLFYFIFVSRFSNIHFTKQRENVHFPSIRFAEFGQVFMMAFTQKLKHTPYTYNELAFKSSISHQTTNQLQAKELKLITVSY